MYLFSKHHLSIQRSFGSASNKVLSKRLLEIVAKEIICIYISLVTSLFRWWRREKTYNILQHKSFFSCKTVEQQRNHSSCSWVSLFMLWYTLRGTIILSNLPYAGIHIFYLFRFVCDMEHIRFVHKTFRRDRRFIISEYVGYVPTAPFAIWTRFRWKINARSVALTDSVAKSMLRHQYHTVVQRYT